MNMMDMLRQAQGGNGIENLARQFGLDRGQTEQILKSVLPAVSTGFKRQAQSQSGLDNILKQIQGNSYEDVYEDPDALRRDDIRDRGNDILGQIFGSKEVSRSVARRTEQNTGIGAEIIKKMLPSITSMVLGGMQRKSTQSTGMNGALDELMKGMLGGGGARPSSGGGALDDILGQVLGQQRPRRRPEPEPRGGGLKDILGGILGGGRRRQAQPREMPQQRRPSDSLDDLLGGILGSSPKQRKRTGNDHLDSVIGMFDSDGDGKVDMDVLRQLARGG